jgi:hypothetical protein
MSMGLTSPTSTTGQILKDGNAVVSFDANNNATFAGTVVSNTPLGMRNRIINGDMRIDQRNAGAAVTLTGSSRYPVDRFIAFYTNTGGVATSQQSSIAPAGFTNSMVYTVTTGAAINTGDYSCIQQNIEGYNVADLDFGLSTAKTVTLSFWVRSSLTGTFSGALNNSGQSRSYVYTYTISAANTWEYKTITITGDTTGSWLKTNGTGLIVYWNMGFQSASLTSTTNTWLAGGFTGVTGGVTPSTTTGATFYITGVQLEVGSVATPFERRMYGDELALCQRYYWKVDGGTTGDYVALGSGVCMSTAVARIYVKYPVTMRGSPTIAYAGTIYADDGTGHTVSAIGGAFEGLDQMMLDFNTNSKTLGRAVICYVVNTAGNNLTASAEL